jgi:phage shock protein PspC (stress-responsive transcriptional regulator)
MEQFKKLYRSEKNKMIGGVAAGFAEYFKIDPTLVRLIFVIAGLAGPGIPFYLIAWLIMPAEEINP